MQTISAQAKRFYLLLGLIVLAGLAVRLGYAAVYKWDQVPWGDALYYHGQANGLVDGRGFINGFIYEVDGVVEIAADHPPLYPLYLAGWSLFGARTFHYHMIASVLLGSLTPGVLGLLGRRVAGDRAGLIGAGIAAVYANLWVHDALVTSETITALMIALAVLLAYRLYDDLTWPNAAWFGLACGLATLTRAEAALLLPIVLAGLLLRRKAPIDRVGRLRLAAVACLVAAVPVLPWVIRNMTAFERPVVLSTGFDITLANTNCDETYYGDRLGWWSLPCANINNRDRFADTSEAADKLRDRGLDYIRDHKSRVPVVLAARAGRMWEVYRPFQKTYLDVIEGRELWAARTALWQYYFLMPFAIGGAIVLWRRRITLVPLLALPVIGTIAGMLAFGNTRYRIPAEIAIVALAAVAMDAILRRWWPVTPEAGTSRDEPDAPEPARDHSEVTVGV